MTKLRICWFGIYDPEYPRNAVLLAGLRARGAEVIECHVLATDPKRHLKLIRKLRALKGAYDVIYVAYPAPSVAPWAWLFGKAPIVVDALYSMFDAVANDRLEVSRLHPRAWKLALLDWFSVLCADLVITDTETYAAYWKKWPFLSRARHRVIPLGVDTRFFTPRPSAGANVPLRVLFYGTYIPLHGVNRIIDAATLLRGLPSVRFTFIGKGQEYAAAMQLIESRGLSNIQVVGKKIPLTEIVDYVAGSDIVLGIFGDTVRARRGVPHKLYQGLSMKKPVITMDTPVVREFFREDEVFMVSGDGESIAAAIRALADDPARREAQALRGYEAVLRFTPERLADMLLESLECYGR